MGRKGIVVLKRLKFRLNEPSSYEQKFFEAMAEIPRHAISFERDSIVSKYPFEKNFRNYSRDERIDLFNRVQIKIVWSRKKSSSAMKILQTLDLKINFLVDSIIFLLKKSKIISALILNHPLRINFAQISFFVHDDLMKRKKDYWIQSILIHQPQRQIIKKLIIRRYPQNS